MVKDENGYLPADNHRNFNGSKNHICQLINVHGVRQIEVHTAEPLVREASALVVDMAVETQEMYKALFVDKIPV